MGLKFGPFDSTRIRYGEMYNDCIGFIQNTFAEAKQHFTLSSAVGQLLQVVLHLGQMILYYIEDSITELNINTATRPNSIKGLARLTGHNPSRAVSARGTLRLQYNNSDIKSSDNVIIIPNHTQIVSGINSLIYTIILPSPEIRLNLRGINNYIDVNVVQGSIEYQSVTGTGSPLQSFNIQPKRGQYIDNYYVNIYVDGEMWESVDSILDMSFGQKAVLIKTGQSGGIDIFFGNTFNGLIPRHGAIIDVEYLITDGSVGNLDKSVSNDNNVWRFLGEGYNINSERIDLNGLLSVSVKNDIIFGNMDEPLYMTQLLAPNVSRSFVLANSNNYNYFLKKLGMFSIIDAFPGYNTYEDKFYQSKLEEASLKYKMAYEEYNTLINKYGVESDITTKKHSEVITLKNDVNKYQKAVDAQKLDDNTVYLFLVPDILKRISPNESYFTCDINTFKLTSNEKIAILDLIEESGQRVQTVDNVILDIKMPKFCINISLIIWENASPENIRNEIYIQLGEYFANSSRRDRIPVSDIIKIIENIEGVDSVTVWFDADKDNKVIYGDSYGIDDYGDIILERFITDSRGNKVGIKDLYPLLRGGFYNKNGVYYTDSLDYTKPSSVNVSFRSITKLSANNIAHKNITSGNIK